jgi:hypothetical protein
MLFFASLKVEQDVTGQVEKGECRVTCEETSTMNKAWTKNTWRDCIGVRMS